MKWKEFVVTAPGTIFIDRHDALYAAIPRLDYKRLCEQSYVLDFYCIPCRQWATDSAAHIHPMRDENLYRAHDQAFFDDAVRDIELMLQESGPS